MEGRGRQTAAIRPRSEGRRKPRRGPTLDAEQWHWRAHWSGGAYQVRRRGRAAFALGAGAAIGEPLAGAPRKQGK
eukprot:11035914-Lingulodinium_polyedra.AAC.1